ncbi:MAG: hypothetical protein WAW37_17980 [Syntrophobacteraceae bacterium]
MDSSIKCNVYKFGEKVTFLVISCDAYSDCWKGFFHGLRKYWPDCPFQVAIVSNFKDAGEPGVRTIKIGEDADWSSNLLMALDRIETPYVLLTCEDGWMTTPVNTGAILDFVRVLDQDRADYIRLHPCPPPDKDFLEDARLGLLADHASYRTSMQMPLWRLSVLKELLRPGENAWEWELNGTIRSRAYHDRFLCVKVLDRVNGLPRYEGIDYINSAVVKRKWSRMAIDYSEKEKLGIDFSRRPVESRWEEFVRTHRIGQLIERLSYGLHNPRRVLRRLRLSLGVTSGPS